MSENNVNSAPTHGSLNDVVNAQFGEADSSANSLEAAFAEKETAELANNEETSQNDTAEPAQDNQFSKKFAALSRKEKALREKEQEYESKFAEMQAQLEALQAPKEEPKEPELPLEYRLRKDPMGTLAELGLGYDKLTELALNDGKLSTDMQMQLMREELEKGYQSKFAELEAKLIEKEKAEEESHYNQVINNFKNEIETHIQSNTEEYELIAASESQNLVYDVIDEHYQETGKIMNIKEASDLVEEHLLEEARKFTKLKKLSAAQAEQAKPSTPENGQSPLTLSNTHSAQVPLSAEQKLSDEESKAAIAQLLKWNE
jgi:hypothetical protein